MRYSCSLVALSRVPVVVVVVNLIDFHRDRGRFGLAAAGPNLAALRVSEQAS